ncbi:MAG: guanylate kinase [Anaerovoracaceae bacterium]
MSEGRLFVISGPSGVGKGTIVNEIMSSASAVKLSISATTRNPREGEIDGKSYFFLSEADFEAKIADDGFLEYAYVHGNYYGTPKKPVIDALKKGFDVILEIDVQGAMQVKSSYKDATYIFVLPPSMEQLETRIRTRGTESEEDISLRLGKALEEIRCLNEYDYYVINDVLELAIHETEAIMKAEHCKISDASMLIAEYEEEFK